jgi:subtilisin family serine protease
MQWAVDHGARVLNMSFASDTRTDTLEQAVNYAFNHGCLPVAASGNDSTGAYYPAAYPQVLSVGALDRAGNRAYYSNFGRVELSAPGGTGNNYCGPVPCPPVAVGLGLIPVAIPAGMSTEIIGASNYSDDGYGAWDGTSFAAPMVAAAAALLFAQDPGRSPLDVQAILESTADPTALGAGYHAETGWGRLNVYRALTAGNSQTNVLGTDLKVYNWPNPFNPDKEGGTQLTFILEKPADATLRVLDASGELLIEKKVSQSQTRAGLNYSRWDGKNGAGVTAASGVYILIVEADGKRGKNRIAVLK